MMSEDMAQTKDYLKIIRMKKDHVDQIVEVHLKSFKGFFLSFLGERFLRLYYNRIVSYPDAIKLVSIENGAVMGFVVGTMRPAGFYSTLLKNDWFRFAVVCVPAILKRPKSTLRLLRALILPEAKPASPSTAELSSLAVSPESQGRGIGEDLVNAFIAECRKMGGAAIYLTTDAGNNEAVNKFYDKMGFNLRKVFVTPEKRVMNEYWYEIL